MADEPETQPESVSEELAESAAPGSVTESLEPVLAKIDEGFNRVIEKLDSLAAPPSGSGESEEHEDHSDTPPIKPPWTHRTPWKRGD